MFCLGFFSSYKIVIRYLQIETCTSKCVSPKVLNAAKCYRKIKIFSTDSNISVAASNIRDFTERILVPVSENYSTTLHTFCTSTLYGNEWSASISGSFTPV